MFARRERFGESVLPVVIVDPPAPVARIFEFLYNFTYFLIGVALE